MVALDQLQVIHVLVITQLYAYCYAEMESMTILVAQNYVTIQIYLLAMDVVQHVLLNLVMNVQDSSHAHLFVVMELS